MAPKMKQCSCGGKPRSHKKQYGQPCGSEFDDDLAYFIVRCPKCTKQTLGAKNREHAKRDWNNDLTLYE